MHTIPVVPRLKLIDPVKDRFADLYERRPDLHRTPVPKRSNRDAAAIALRDFLRGKKFVVQCQPPSIDNVVSLIR